MQTAIHVVCQQTETNTTSETIFTKSTNLLANWSSVIQITYKTASLELDSWFISLELKRFYYKLLYLWLVRLSLSCNTVFKLFKCLTYQQEMMVANRSHVKIHTSDLLFQEIGGFL